MKIVYRNVSQVIETLAWTKVIKEEGQYRNVLLGTCAEYANATKIVAKVKILTNRSSIQSCNIYLGVGSHSDINNVANFYGSQNTLDLTVGNVADFSRTFTVRQQDVTNGLDLKIGIVGNSISENYDLATKVSFEVEYYIQ